MPSDELADWFKTHPARPAELLFVSSRVSTGWAMHK